MIGFLLGSITTTGAICTGLAIKIGNTEHLRNLNQETEALLEAVSWSYKSPSSEGPTIPMRDVVSIYLNSRSNRNWVNERRLENKDCLFLLEKMASDHRLIKKLALACLLGCPVDRLDGNCGSIRHKRLLWMYADELAVLNQLADFCAPQDRYFIAARV